MDNKKINGKDIRFFIIPFIILTMVFFALTYVNTKSRVNEILELKKKSTIEIADSYVDALVGSKEALEITTQLLDEKILVASQAVLLLDEKISNVSLADLADKFKVDQINLYNKEGVIIYSNIKEYVGWKAYAGHPVSKFMNSTEDTLVENIRQDTVDHRLYKFGHVKRDDDTFVQIGVLAENVSMLTSKFELQKIIDDIKKREDVREVFFTDQNLILTASSDSKYVGMQIPDQEGREHLNLKQTDVELSSKFYGDGFIHSCAPVFYNGAWLGTLSIVWDGKIVEQEVGNIISNAAIELLLVITTVGYIMYYAYRKDSANYQLAYYDELTGLPNGIYLEEYLAKRIHNIDKKKKAILLLNSTNFKMINHIYGYKYGDRILKQIAARVQTILDEDGVFFRFNADRFVLYVEGYKNKEELEKLAQKLIGIFRNPFKEGPKHEYVNAQVAIFEMDDVSITVDKALQSATVALSNLDNAMNEQIVFFTKELEDTIKRHEKIESAIKAVILGEDTESFYLAFQPKADTITGKTVGFEALARLEIHGIGFVSPLEFIALAEKRMLIYDLGNFVLKKACLFLNELRSAGIEGIPIAVNISLIQLLRDEFLTDVLNIINEHEVNPNMLEFEITESVLEENFDIVNLKLEKLKKAGISIAIDDFGTGFSSFARLIEMNIDVIKIDKYFIDNIIDKEKSSLISADIISMGHKLGLRVVAEGVEYESQRQYLKEHGCDILQGYLISKPLKSEDALIYMKNRTV